MDILINSEMDFIALKICPYLSKRELHPVFISAVCKLISYNLHWDFIETT
jgi:hypothetical protein